MQTVAAMLAVTVTWAVAGTVLVGLGSLTRRMLGLVARAPDTAVSSADSWIGLAIAIAYLQLWSLVAPINTTATLPLIVAGAAGAVASIPFTRIARPLHRPILFAVFGLSILWIADLSLGAPTSYDSGLYHFAAIDYASHFPAIPGLGNLHDRLGADGPHFLLVAALGIPPWSGAGFHLANGLLAAMLVVELALRVAHRTSRDDFRALMALVLLAAVLTVIAVDPGGRISSPSIDFPALVLFAVGSLYLADVVSNRGDLPSLLAATGGYALATAVRPSLFPAALVAVGIAAWRQPPRILAVSVVIPGAVLLGWLARQAILTGFPLFPIGPSLPVDWSMTHAARDAYTDAVLAWARQPGAVPRDVLGSWGWLGGWASRTATNLDVVLVLIVTAAGVVFLATSNDASRRVQRSRFGAVAAPALTALVVWFLLVPDPRFAYGPAWVFAGALVAWSFPARHRSWLFAMIALALVVAVTASTRRGIPIVIADGNGPFGSISSPIPPTRIVTSDAGARVRIPVVGDRCWSVRVCSPSVTPHLRVRGESFPDGFSVEPMVGRTSRQTCSSLTRRATAAEQQPPRHGCAAVTSNQRIRNGLRGQRE